MLDLDKHSPIPLYYQLADQIRQQINAGELRPGDQLPAERELSEQASISRMTARQAIAYLVRAAASGEIPEGSTVLINLSGRGDKDAEQVMQRLAMCRTHPCEPVCEGCPSR